MCAEVGTGDVVLIPYGYHGPSMAAPGYDLYYLNVMGGPGNASGGSATTPRTRGSGPSGPASPSTRGCR